MNRAYLKISSRDKNKLINIASQIFKKEIEPKNFNNIYFIEEFNLSGDLNIPRYLIKDDINLIYIKDSRDRSSRYSRAENNLYYDGFLNINLSSASQIFLTHKQHLTKKEVALLSLEKNYEKNVFELLMNIEGSNLFYSIIETVTELHETAPEFITREMEMLYKKEFKELAKYFESCKNLNLQAFIGLFI